MLDFLKNKKYPEFWKSYLQKNENKPTRFVTLSLHTTGLNPQKDVILTVAGVGVTDSQLIIQDTFEVILLQYIYNHDNGFSNEFILESKLPKSTEADGIEALITYLENATIIGHRVDFDLEMINKALGKLGCGALKNEALDLEIMFKKWNESSEDKTFSVAEIAEALKLPEMQNESSGEAAFTMGLCFLKLKKYLRID